MAGFGKLTSTSRPDTTMKEGHAKKLKELNLTPIQNETEAKLKQYLMSGNELKQKGLIGTTSRTSKPKTTALPPPKTLSKKIAARQSGINISRKSSTVVKRGSLVRTQVHPEVNTSNI